MTFSQLLIHFDADFLLILACDSSSYGVEAVQAHRMPDESEKLIAFTSWTLSSAEQNYAQEKEGLILVHARMVSGSFTLIPVWSCI